MTSELLTIVNFTVIGFALPLALLAVSLAVYGPGVSAFLPIRPVNATALAPGCRFFRVSVPALIARVHFLAPFLSLAGTATQLLPRLTPGAERAIAIVIVAGAFSVNLKFVRPGPWP